MTRTRFAPSPTGYMHIGTLRSALFAYLIAKHDNGEFVLRIEDTDQNRKKIGAEEFVYDMLKVFGLNYDEGPNKDGEYGPYIQSQRLDIYKSYAEKLIRKGDCYYCFCTEETLNEKRIESQEKNTDYLYNDPCRILSINEARNRVLAGEKYVIRQKMPKEGQTSYRDLVYGGVTIENATLEDQIIIKSDGYPTYNFANVIDDALMHITHVTRGNEYISSTPKYILLYDALGFPHPNFIHLPLVIKKDNQKLDKCSKDDNLLDLLEQGFLPEAIINYIAFLGWSPKTNQEFFTLEELVRAFDIKNISQSPSCYDIKKLEWYNKHYIMQMDDEKYLKFIRPYLEKFYNLNDKSEEWITKLLKTYKNHISFGAEIAIVTSVFFRENIELDDESINTLKNTDLFCNTLIKLKSEIESCNNWNIDSIKQILNNIEPKENLYMPIRIAITGMKHGPSLEDTIYLLGQEKVINRISYILQEKGGQNENI